MRADHLEEIFTMWRFRAMIKLFTGKKRVSPLLRSCSKFVRPPQRRQIEPTTDGIVRPNYFVRLEGLCQRVPGQHE